MFFCFFLMSVSAFECGFFFCNCFSFIKASWLCLSAIYRKARSKHSLETGGRYHIKTHTYCTGKKLNACCAVRTNTHYNSHAQHTLSLIAVIKQLNLEQQLLMWRVGVLAGSVIITRINITHTHTEYIQILSPRHVYTARMHVRTRMHTWGSACMTFN